MSARTGAAPGRPAPRRGGRLAVALGLLVATAALAGGQDDIAPHRECGYCGMDRKAYGFSRMLVRYEDGGEAGVCSLRCTLVELDANPGRAVKELLVADRNTRDLVEAGSATWVLGGRKRGVMTARAKWAFATPEAAQAFVEGQGGEIVSWERAREAAREDLVKDLEVEKAERRARPFGCAAPAAGASAAPAPAPAP